MKVPFHEGTFYAHEGRVETFHIGGKEQMRGEKTFRSCKSDRKREYSRQKILRDGGGGNGKSGGLKGGGEKKKKALFREHEEGRSQMRRTKAKKSSAMKMKEEKKRRHGGGKEKGTICARKREKKGILD